MSQSFRTVVIAARKKQASSQSDSSQNSESMRKLRSLRDKILNREILNNPVLKEYEVEKSERDSIDLKEPHIIPLSLASDFFQKQKSPNASNEAQQVKDKIQHLKIDKMLQNELETGLEVKANEMNVLKYQNKRLKDIIMLRERCNTRKETAFEQEIGFLKNLMDDVCVESREHNTMMQRLKALNEQIQDEFELLKTTIEDKAETERLALIRTYRVRMRDVKQQLSNQEAMNLAGAKAWITRFEMLNRDRAEAERDCENLKMQNAAIQDSNNETRVMHQHQERQRESLTQKIVLLRRENKRLEDHIEKLSEKLSVVKGYTLSCTQNVCPSKYEHFYRKDPQREAQEEIVNRQVDLVVESRKTLEAVRRSLKQVQTAHVKLLQERTELEIFLKQCVDDVRQLYRHTVTTANIINQSGSSRDLNSVEEANFIQKYGFKEKEELIDILYSKLKVLYILHKKMFPHKAFDQIFGGCIQATDESDQNNQQTIMSDVDTLWQRWKDWSNLSTIH